MLLCTSMGFEGWKKSFLGFLFQCLHSRTKAPKQDSLFDIFSFGFHLKGREMIKIASHNHPWQGCDMKFSLFLQLAFVEEFFKDSKCILEGSACNQY